MIILFSPSESKTQLDGYSSICKESFIFQDQYAKRIEAVKIYNEYIQLKYYQILVLVQKTPLNHSQIHFLVYRQLQISHFAYME